MIFQTARLIVRDLTLEDFSSFHEMQGNSRVMRYTTGMPMTQAENEEDLKRVISLYHKANNDYWVWGIVRKEDAQWIGTCALINNEKNENEIGYRLLERFWGMGYGMEITHGLIDYCFNQLKVDALVAYVHQENIVSIKILEQSGFRFMSEVENKEQACIDRYYKIQRQTS